MLLLNAAEKEEELLEIANTAALMNVSEEAKHAMERSSKSMNSVCHEYTTTTFVTLSSSTRVLPEKN